VSFATSTTWTPGRVPLITTGAVTGVCDVVLLGAVDVQPVNAKSANATATRAATPAAR